MVGSFENMNLDHDQNKFYTEMSRHIQAGQKGMYLLNAAAGTGKTFTCAKFLEQQDYKVVFLAYTHAAVNVLKSHPILKMNPHVEIKTIHSFFNSVPSRSAKCGTLKFSFRRFITNDLIIIVDECSMINRSMFNMFSRIASNNFIIFIGDELQLPPVSESTSPCFSLPCSWTLQKQQRASDHLLFQRVRDWVQGNDELPKFEKCRDFNNVTVLCHSNVAANTYNLRARARLYGDNEMEYVSGENFYDQNGELKRISNVTVYKEFIEFRRHDSVPFKKRKSGLDLEFYRIELEDCSVLQKPVCRSEWFKIKKHWNDLCKQLQQVKEWSAFHDFCKEYDADIQRPYAMTIYKAQGKTLGNVAFDMRDIQRCTSGQSDSTLYKRLVYVAVTRAKGSVFVVS